MVEKKIQKVYTPDELKTLFEALNIAPSYLSKRFVLKSLCGWSDTMVDENVNLKREEAQKINSGDRVWI